MREAEGILPSPRDEIFIEAVEVKVLLGEGIDLRTSEVTPVALSLSELDEVASGDLSFQISEGAPETSRCVDHGRSDRIIRLHGIIPTVSNSLFYEDHPQK